MPADPILVDDAGNLAPAAPSIETAAAGGDLSPAAPSAEASIALGNLSPTNPEAIA